MSAMSERTDIDLAALRAHLVNRKAELEALTDSSDESRRPVELDQTRVGRLSRMDALQSQAMAQATERRRSGELYRINAALVRLDGGDYGYCSGCDEPIGAKRLELDPSIATCIICAERGG